MNIEDDFEELEELAPNNVVEIKNTKKEREPERLPNMGRANVDENKQRITDELGSWFQGKVDFPSKSIESYLESTKDKAKVASTFIVASQMSRIDKLSRFADMAEDLIFDEESIPYTPINELTGLYRLAIARMNEIRRLNNEYLLELEDGDGDISRVTAMVRSLEPEQIQKLLKVLKEIKKDGAIA